MPDTKAPPSETPGPKRWTPAGLAFAAAAVASAGGLLATAFAPYFTKPDLSGYVKEERLTSCEAKLEARAESHEKALDGERDRTARCYDKLGACQSQTGAQEQVIESFEAKPKKRR